ncbi:MAG: hypothetical protein RR506_06715, partial [Akkermansia sp.]
AVAPQASTATSAIATTSKLTDQHQMGLGENLMHRLRLTQYVLLQPPAPPTKRKSTGLCLHSFQDFYLGQVWADARDFSD